MRALNTNTNVDNSDLTNYPDGRIKNNTGTGNGTPVNERVYGDMHQNFAKLMRLYGITPNNLPDNETNGFQIIESIVALASKNDFILTLSLNSGVLSVPIKLGFMLENESLVCKAGFDLGAETQIKGSDSITYGFTAIGSFKTNEYVRVVKTASGVTVVRLADDISLNDMVSNLLFLKKATQPEEDAGVIDTKATTPLTNLLAFVKRVNGTDSINFLATLLRNGIYPKEHFAIVNGLSLVKNTGWISGIDVGLSSGTLSRSGDVVSAVYQPSLSNNSIILVTLQNAMNNSNYLVKTYLQSEGDILQDNDVCVPVFKILSTTQFLIGLQEVEDGAQSIKLHVEVINL